MPFRTPSFNPRFRPTAPMRINRQNRYGARLLWCVLPGIQFNELVTGAMGATVGTVTWGKVTGDGLSCNAATAGGNGVKWVNSHTAMANQLTSAGWSTLAICNLTAGSVSNGMIMCFPASEVSWTDPFLDFDLQLNVSLGSAGAGANEWGTSTTTGTNTFPVSNPSGTWSTGFHVYGTSWNGTTESTYQDGGSTGTFTPNNNNGAVPTKPTFSGTPGYIFMGGAAQSAESTAGDIYMVAVLNGPLSAQDMTELYQNPYQMFEPLTPLSTFSTASSLTTTQLIHSFWWV